MTTMEQMKQAFLKRFNIWGDTRHQQQDAWNKLVFDMSKDDVDSFVTEMHTLVSILRHNNNFLDEKFKDIFPNKNIETALIAMDDFDEMQAKAKQLVQIYKPTAGTDTSTLGACLMHTHEEKPSVKPKKGPPKVSNQHQLAPTQNNSGTYRNNSSGQNQGQRRNDQKGFNKDNGSYQDTRGYFTENNFRKIAAEAVAGVVMEKEANLPGRTIMIIRDRAHKKVMTHKEVVVVEVKIIKVEARAMSKHSNNTIHGIIPNLKGNISICHCPQPHPRAFFQHLHHMIQTGN